MRREPQAVARLSLANLRLQQEAERVDAEGTRYLFSPAPPDQMRDSARRHGLTQLLLGSAADLTAYPIDALNSTPFIVDNLSSAFGYVLARYQVPRRPLPRTDRWYLYLARSRASRWTARLERRVRQTGVLRRFTDRLHGASGSTDLILNNRSHLYTQ